LRRAKGHEALGEDGLLLTRTREGNDGITRSAPSETEEYELCELCGGKQTPLINQPMGKGHLSETPCENVSSDMSQEDFGF